jgi:Uma2 family endonuclease
MAMYKKYGVCVARSRRWLAGRIEGFAGVYNRRMPSTVAERLMTEDDFLALPDHPEGRKRELLDGKVIILSQPGETHTRLARVIFVALLLFAESRRLGEALFDAGFRIRTNPDRIVNPDVAFIRAGTLDPLRSRVQTFHLAPWLAVEIRSPHSRRGPVAAKIAEYLEAGSTRVWDIDPVRRTVTVRGYPAGPRVRRDGEVLTSEDAGFDVDGFELSLQDLFDAAGA